VLRALISRICFNAGAFSVAVMLALSIATVPVKAQSNLTGSLVGTAAKGTVVNVEEVNTGFKRSVTAGSDGDYRISALPPGQYKVSFTDANGQAQEREASVSIGSATTVGEKDGVVQLEDFVIDASTINPVDFSQTEKMTLLTDAQMAILPISRDLTSIALQASGTTVGDIGFAEAFRTLPSFGGSSVSENATYVNGFNISNFRNGLYGAEVPFEFFDQFEVKTGGFSAEFGRSTGGVINTTTKRGTNKYKAGFNTVWYPNAGRSKSPSSWFVNSSGAVVPKVYNDADKYETLETNIYASGPLWKNKLFLYGLYTLRDYKREDITTNGTQHLERSSDDPFWGAKLDFTPISGQRLEYTIFRDKSRLTQTQTPYNLATNSLVSGSTPSLLYSDRGGTTHVVNYNGTFFDKLQVSALWGKMTIDLTDSGTQDSLPFIYDGRSGSLVYIQGNPNLLISNANDERIAKRLDLSFPFELWGKHTIRAGYDVENNLSNDQSRYSGGLYYRYYAIPTSGVVNGAPVPPGTTAAVRSRTYMNGGSFTVNSEAWYLEDNWSLMNDRLNLRLGVRNETFENLNSLNEPFIKISNQRAPRLGATFDLFNNKKTKLHFNYGRYHLPVASNTNVRLAGGETFIEKYNVLTSVGADGKNPVLGAQIGVTNTFSDGTIRDRREIVDMDVKPMYQDEWMAGFQHSINSTMSVGMNFITRTLDGTAMDDMIVDHALTEWANANGFPGFDATGEHAYVLANPGRPIHMFWDFDGSGTLDANEEARLTPEMLDYPTATRKYNSVEIYFEKSFDKKWFANVSYTWSQSYGNYEGWVLSDNDQDDAGITILFDSPLATTNTYGKLPNDRRHQLKVLGAYSINSEFTLGATALLASGRPINKIGLLNDPVRGGSSNDYLLAPRGSLGTTPSVFKIDLSLTYRPKWAKNRLTARIDVYNLFNGKAVTEVEEVSQTASGSAEPSYGTVKAWQTPRHFRLSVGYDY
jgi:hypothetical protein